MKINMKKNTSVIENKEIEELINSVIDSSWKSFNYSQLDGNDPKQNLRAYFESGNVDRYAKEAIYQESHRTDSPIWYYASDDKKRRVRFKLIVTDTN